MIFKMHPRRGIELMFFLIICGMVYFNLTFEAQEEMDPLQEEDLPSIKKKIQTLNDRSLLLTKALAFNRPSQVNPTDYLHNDGCDFANLVLDFKPMELLINCDNLNALKKGKKIGSGYWRKVYEGDFKGRKVAMKLVRESLLERSDIVNRHVKEASVLFQLLNSPNVVKMLGWCNSTIIVEYVSEFLEDIVFNPNQELSVQRALEYALDASKGVAQLHASAGGPFAHTDIQTRQFLINDRGTVLLNDFNRIKYSGPHLLIGKEETKCNYRTPVAKGKWRSPEEYADSKKLDEKVDVYSLSMVLWSLRSREKPFEDIERDVVYSDVVEKGIRPDIEKMSDFPPAMQELIIQGWDQDPTRRPTAQQMVYRIEAILNTENPSADSIEKK